MSLEASLSQPRGRIIATDHAHFWPPSGQPIDLFRHDPAHDAATLEWWYVHAHLHDPAGHEYAFFAAFFRSGADDRGDLDPRHLHALTWRLTRLDGGDEIQVTLLDAATPRVVRERLKTSTGDPFFRRALAEIVERDEVPSPERLLSRPARADTHRLDLDYDGNRLTGMGDGRYRLSVRQPDGDARIDLEFTLGKPVTRHGDDGFVRGVSAESMFYYFCPRCTIEGTLIRGGARTELAGESWYDHEFGREEDDQDARLAGTETVAWNWIALQLDNGWELTAYDLFDGARDWESAGRWLVAIDPDGRRRTADFSLTPADWYISTRTFVRWPVAWKLAVPELGLDFEVVAPIPQQEYQTLISQPAFWEGRVNASGVMGGERVTGRGFVERSGFEAARGINELLRTVGEVTRDSLQRLLPDRPTRDDLVRLVARPDFPEHTAGMDPERVQELVIAPIRHVVDLGGKAWRSYALLACIDLVGGDSSEFRDWLAVPELIHVGSLIVDDVQDRSVLRRGGRPAHEIWGEALALNAGSAAYFLSHHLLEEADLDPARKVRLYETFFHTMRAAHVGQAFDIAGHGDGLRAAQRTGDTRALLDQVLLTHRLKSAVPAGNLARMGALLGGATPAQEAALGKYFEALGIAFQVVDDVIDIRGPGGLKSRGGDLLEGKVTAPVVLALPRLSPADRNQLSDLLLAPERTPEQVTWMIERLEECGALDSAQEIANRMLDEAWVPLDAAIENSYTKISLRAFSWYLLERQY